MKQRCYICDEPADEIDHFPRSRSLGGTETLPICASCHTEKDRATIDGWDPAAFHQAVLGLWNKADAAERLAIAKMVHVVNQAIACIKKAGLTKGMK